jgi:hypothetical protein
MKAHVAWMLVFAVVLAAFTMAGPAFAGQTEAERERAHWQKADPVLTDDILLFIRCGTPALFPASTDTYGLLRVHVIRGSAEEKSRRAEEYSSTPPGEVRHVPRSQRATI